MGRFSNFQQAIAVMPAELRRYRELDFARIRRLHFVCKGNVCRSAYAEYRARQWGMACSSSGVEAGSAQPADDSAQRNALARGVRLDSHATRPLAEVALDEGDLIVAMEPWHARASLLKALESRAQVTLLGLWGRRRARVIADPYGESDEVFSRCFDEIDDSLFRLTRQLPRPGGASLPRLAPDARTASAWSLSWRRRLKPLLGRLLFGSGAYRLFLRDRAVVTAFHSVIAGVDGDSLRTPLADFERHIRFFKRYFEVTTLHDLVDRLESGRPISRLLVITFDDGYEDNHSLAAPVLDAAGVRATFFVSTGFIGSKLQAPWDQRKNRVSVWMDWQQVADLAARGHEVSAHTISHSDVGKLASEELAAELAGCMDEIERHTGLRPSTFALPFGLPESLTDEVRQACARLGIRACVTAVGGAVAPSSPPIGLNRFPVNVADAPSVYAAGVDILVDCMTVDRRRAAEPPS